MITGLGGLLLHGLTGSTHSVEGVAAALAADGVTVRAPMLPGHGTTVDDLDGKRWADWLGCAQSELAALDGPVVLFGLSMGGSLACWLAAEHPDRIAGLILVNPFVDPPAPSFRASVRGVIEAGFPRAPGIAGDVADRAVIEKGYGELPLEALLSLCEGLDDVAARLSAITCPILLFSSRTDHVVPTESGDLVVGRVSGPVERVWLEDSFHVATLDHDRDLIEQQTVAFARKVASTIG